MSQPGYVYFIGSSDGPVKVGRAKDPRARLHDLQTAHHERLGLLGAFLIEDAQRFESALHKALERWQLVGEWFVQEEVVEPLCFGLHHAAEDASLSSTEQVGMVLVASCAPGCRLD